MPIAKHYGKSYRCQIRALLLLTYATAGGNIENMDARHRIFVAAYIDKVTALLWSTPFY